MYGYKSLDLFIHFESKESKNYGFIGSNDEFDYFPDFLIPPPARIY